MPCHGKKRKEKKIEWLYARFETTGGLLHTQQTRSGVFALFMCFVFKSLINLFIDNIYLLIISSAPANEIKSEISVPLLCM